MSSAAEVMSVDEQPWVLYVRETRGGWLLPIPGLPLLGERGGPQPLVGDVLVVGEDRWQVIRREWHVDVDSDRWRFVAIAVAVEDDRPRSGPRAV